MFSYDSKIFQLINKLCYSVWLNLLWLICSIPIITIGASTTALYYVSLKIVRNQEGNVTKQFFNAFKENFKKSTLIWLILLLFGIILGIDGYILYHIRFSNTLWTLCSSLLIAVCMIYFILLLNIFPLLSRFDNKIPAMLKNALFIGIRYLFRTFLMAAVYFVIYYIMTCFFAPLIIMGHGLGALICARIISPVFRKVGDHVDEYAY